MKLRNNTDVPDFPPVYYFQMKKMERQSISFVSPGLAAILSFILLLGCDPAPLAAPSSPDEAPAGDTQSDTPYIESTQNPVFETAEGTHHKDIAVCITCENTDAVIYYTSDGSEPDSSSTEYISPISIAGDGTTVVLKSIADSEVMGTSEVITASYQIEYFTLTVLSDGGGTVTPVSAVKTAQDAVNVVTASPSGNNIFTEWSVESGSGVFIDDISSDTTDVILTSDSGIIQANFRQPYSMETKLTASDAESGDSFGTSVGLSEDGTTMVSGAYGDGDNGEISGAIYILEWNGSSWIETKILASDGGAGDMFGCSVDVSEDGDTIVSGAYHDDDKGERAGAIYIYKWNGSSWAETKLTASDGSEYEYFGQSVVVSADGNTVISGASRDNDNGVFSGALYIYKWNGSSWAETKLTASDGGENDFFGLTVDVSGDGSRVIAGADRDDDEGPDAGCLYIYSWDGSDWIETKLTASDSAGYDYFGYSACISGDGETIVSGAYLDDDMGTTSGSIYIYHWSGSGWDETKLTASDGAAQDNYGFSVSVSSNGNTVGAGAINDDDFTGSAYIYAWDGSSWDETKLAASDGEGNDKFGTAIRISGDGSRFISGVPQDDDNGSSSGSIYIYH